MLVSLGCNTPKAPRMCQPLDPCCSPCPTSTDRIIWSEPASALSCHLFSARPPPVCKARNCFQYFCHQNSRRTRRRGQGFSQKWAKSSCPKILIWSTRFKITADSVQLQPARSCSANCCGKAHKKRGFGCANQCCCVGKCGVGIAEWATPSSAGQSNTCAQFGRGTVETWIRDSRHSEARTIPNWVCRFWIF